MTVTTEDRLAALEARLRAAEDHLALLNLVNTYGPLADSGMDTDAAALWVEGGGYNYTLPDGGTQRLEAPEPLAGMYRSEGHMGLVNTGCAHLNATPKITVSGDEAEAVGYSFVVLREADRWFLWRAAVNHWQFVRTGQGWRVKERFNRTLDGSDISHETMRKVRAI